MAVGDAYVFPGFLTPVLTLLFFQSHRLLFSHASAEVRGENTPERKVASTWDRTHNHQVMSPTRSPLSHPGGLRNSVNSLISICLSDLKDQKLPGSAKKTQIDDNRPKILLARWAHKWSRQLACSNYGPNRAIGMSANVKT